MRKANDRETGEGDGGEKEKKIITEIVAINIVASLNGD